MNSVTFCSWPSSTRFCRESFCVSRGVTIPAKKIAKNISIVQHKHLPRTIYFSSRRHNSTFHIYNFYMCKNCIKIMYRDRLASSVTDPWHFGTDPVPRIRASDLNNGSGSGSCYSRQWPSRRQQKTMFLYVIKKSKNSRNHGFSSILLDNRRIRIRIQEAQKHTATDPDPQYW